MRSLKPQPAKNALRKALEMNVSEMSFKCLQHVAFNYI